jgi:hypothetical protein
MATKGEFSLLDKFLIMPDEKKKEGTISSRHLALFLPQIPSSSH